ncbi:hypothetical protein RRG08_060119 [Elysia crispata]|uniref:Uncharacterized protein n=1 Tax=Elysia crispata TaxID=231223 RepID=A0AAE1EDP7_9GAST|nr:hypothetical protein RRG08_060119 [Elysia crispata]
MADWIHTTVACPKHSRPTLDKINLQLERLTVLGSSPGLHDLFSAKVCEDYIPRDSFGRYEDAEDEGWNWSARPYSCLRGMRFSKDLCRLVRSPPRPVTGYSTPPPTRDSQALISSLTRSTRDDVKVNTDRGARQQLLRHQQHQQQKLLTGGSQQQCDDDDDVDDGSGGGKGEGVASPMGLAARQGAPPSLLDAHSLSKNVWKLTELRAEATEQRNG